MKQNLFYFLLYILIFCQKYVNGQRTVLTQQIFKKQLEEKKDLIFSDNFNTKNFVRNYVGDPEADMTVVSFCLKNKTKK